MPREWTDEQREEARQRAKAQGLSGAKVEERPIEPVAPIHAARRSEVLIAEHESRTDRTVEQNQDEDGNPVMTTHVRPGTIIMYKPLPTGGYEPRRCSVTAIAMNLRNGWGEHCPDCGKKHVDSTGQESPDPNLCSARPPVAVILCPVCRLRIYDNIPYSQSFPESEGDPNVINPDDLQENTAEQRLITARNLHLWMNHPRSAQERNIPPLPEALRDMVKGA
jgi:hypothetical protein